MFILQRIVCHTPVATIDVLYTMYIQSGVVIRGVGQLWFVIQSGSSHQLHSSFCSRVRRCFICFLFTYGQACGKQKKILFTLSHENEQSGYTYISRIEIFRTIRISMIAFLGLFLENFYFKGGVHWKLKHGKSILLPKNEQIQLCLFEYIIYIYFGSVALI